MRIEVHDASTPEAKLWKPTLEILSDQRMLHVLEIGAFRPIAWIGVPVPFPLRVPHKSLLTADFYLTV